jgi:glycosyltransferase involved in cell wall biosynthesis
LPGISRRPAFSAQRIAIVNHATCTAPINLQVVQPVVPHYRLPFFDGVAARSDLRLRLLASPRIAGNPDSVAVPKGYADTSLPCLEFAGGRLLWQKGLSLDPRLGRGDVLVLEGNPRFASNLPLLLAARRRGVAVVWWGHGWSATSRPWRARLRRTLMRLADVVVLYTEDERRHLIEQGFAPERVYALNNALDQSAIRLAVNAWTPAALAGFRRLHGLDDCRLLLFCGRLRLDPPTDLDVALEALARLTASDPTYRLAVIGDGPDAARLAARARMLGVDPQVHWVGALYEEAQLAPWFLSARCFVYPGPIGLSLLQAFGYGLPVITHGSRQQHNPEIAALREGGNGLTFPRGDAGALAERIARVCGDEDYRSGLAAEARRTVETEYTLEGMLERFTAAVNAARRLRPCALPAQERR